MLRNLKERRKVLDKMIVLLLYYYIRYIIICVEQVVRPMVAPVCSTRG